jgi:hypothetical protein
VKLCYQGDRFLPQLSNGSVARRGLIDEHSQLTPAPSTAHGPDLFAQQRALLTPQMQATAPCAIQGCPASGQLSCTLAPWPESAKELRRSSDRRLSVKLVPTFMDRGCHVVSVTDPYGRILGFLDLSRYISSK